MVWGPEYQLKEKVYGFKKHLLRHESIYRSEFEAALHGLQTILNGLGIGTKKEITRFLEGEGRKCVLIMTDNQALEGTINGTNEGKACPDLVHQLLFYQRIFDIKAKHVKRKTSKVHDQADVMASECRILGVWYDESINKNAKK